MDGDGFFVMIFIVAAFFGGLVAGYNSDVTPEEVEWAETVCEPNGGLTSFDHNTATCENGAVFEREP